MPGFTAPSTAVPACEPWARTETETASGTDDAWATPGMARTAAAARAAPVDMIFLRIKAASGEGMLRAPVSALWLEDSDVRTVAATVAAADETSMTSTVPDK